MRILEHDQLRNFFYELTSNFLFVIVYVIRFEYIIFYRLRSHQWNKMCIYYYSYMKSDRT